MATSISPDFGIVLDKQLKPDPEKRNDDWKGL